MTSRGLDPVSFFDRAMVAAGTVEEPRERAFAYYFLARGCLGCDHVTLAGTCIDAAVESALSIGPVHKRSDMLAFIARMRLEADGRKKARKELLVVEKLAGEIEQPSRKASALSDLARALNRVGDKKHALGLLETATDIVCSLPTSPARSADFSHLSTSYYLLDDFERALELSRMIENENLKGYMLFLMVNLLEDKGDDELSRRFLHLLLKELERGPSRPEKDYVVEHIAMEYVRLGDRERALALLTAMLDDRLKATRLIKVIPVLNGTISSDEVRGVIDSVYDDGRRTNLACDVVRCLIENGRKDEATKLLEAYIDTGMGIAEPGVRAIALSRVSGALARLEHEQRSHDVFYRALDSAHMIRNGDVKGQLLFRMAEGLAGDGEHERAAHVVDMIDDEHCRIDYLLKKAEWLVECGHQDLAIRGLDRALFSVRAFRGKRYTDDSDELFGRIAEGYANAGAHDKALQALDLAAHGYSGNGACKVVSALIGHGELDRALALLEDITPPPMSPDAIDHTITDVALVCAKTGRAEHALSIMGRVSSRTTYYSTLVDIAENQANEGDVEAALSVVERIDDGFWKADLLGKIAYIITTSGESLDEHA